jgi:tRNA U54 and U55 pseudouridine synthase Pus10
MSQATSPSPYATHADLNQLRREIQADVRFEVRELTTELRATVKELNAAQVTSKQFTVTTVLSFINAACMLYYAVRGH